MAVFTHDHASRTPAEFNPATAYVSSVIVCRNYVASQDKWNGTRYTQQYHDLKRQGYVFVDFVPAEAGQRFKHVIMMKPVEASVDVIAPFYGDKVTGIKLNACPGGDLRVVYSFDWGNNFTPSVIAGDCIKSEMRALITELANGDADILAYAAEKL